MKQIVSNYSYSPATNVVTLTGVNIDADQLLLIVAPEVSRTMYNFASVTGVVSAGANTRITLNASTVGLTTTSPLVIFYDDQAGAQSVTGTVALDPASLIALENVTVTIGSSVSVSNFPATQTVAGTVTANFLTNPNYSDIDGYRGMLTQVGGFDFPNARTSPIYVDEDEHSLWVKVTNPISGTVTANVGLQNFVAQGLVSESDDVGSSAPRLVAGVFDANGMQFGDNKPFPISGTVTIGNSVTIGNTVTVSQSGSVTIGAMPNGTLTTRFGTPTTANTAFATSAVTNTSRKYLLIQNVTTGSNVITVGIGFTPTTTQGIQLTAGAGITFESSYIPTGAVQILSSVTASNFTILEA